MPRTFRITILFVILAELMSFYGHFFDRFNAISFFVVFLLALAVSLVRLEYGFYALLTELFVGSKGHLFYLDFGGAVISVRMALFAAVAIAFLVGLARKKTRGELFSGLLRGKKLFFAYGLILVVIAWGVVNGILQGNGLANVFLDANGWLFFALLPVFFACVRSKGQIRGIFQIFAAAMAYVGAKTLFLLLIFSHRVNLLTSDLYLWSHETGFAEITAMARNFYRIFSQAQIYSLAGFFIFLALLVFFSREEGNFLPGKKFLWIGLALTSLPVLISFSRSFWLGAIGGLGVMFWTLKFNFRFGWKKIFALAGFLVALLVLEIGLVYALINFPRPEGQTISFASMIEKRVMTSGGEDASLSRFNMLGPLVEKIARHPAVGSGFGAEVSYKSLDPRNVGESPDDLYATYSFEWGYLGMGLKIGLAGLLVYLFFIWKIWKQGWQIIKFKIQNSKLKIKENEEMGRDASLVFGMMLGLVALLVTHIASPYLDHPLGIGYLMLCAAVFEALDGRNIKI